MKTLRIILGYVFLIPAYAMFVLDRIICTLTPNITHEKFEKWLNADKIIYGIARVLTIAILYWLYKWLF
jgi:hypothetical protein